MNTHSSPPAESPPPTADENQGEGNRDAARHYNEATKRFVESPKGRDEIAHAGEVDPSELPQLEDAEETGKAHSKG